MDLKLTKEQQLILIGLIASIVIGLGVMAFRPFFTSSQQQPQLVVQPKGGQAPRVSVTVQVCGAVRREGVYKLGPGDRILEALALAGGAQPLADLSAVNLAETLKDGEKILIPLKPPPVSDQANADQAVQSNRPNNKAAFSGVKININTADEQTLDSLPGVGPATAKAIVEYRRVNGAFAKPEQIMEIPRFGKSKFERVKNMIII
ncbi:MAG TPA: ComEA family DNA-binding protein [Candidatus Sulfotelmatobacter sp.]|nr:ComEA family DNA-binding protein [Candidatus Sulfotelmatobacter sp.]